MRIMGVLMVAFGGILIWAGLTGRSLRSFLPGG